MVWPATGLLTCLDLMDLLRDGRLNNKPKIAISRSWLDELIFYNKAFSMGPMIHSHLHQVKQPGNVSVANGVQRNRRPSTIGSSCRPLCKRLCNEQASR